MAGNLSYRSTLVKIAAEITSNNLEDLKFFFKSVVPDGKLDKIERATGLFWALEDCRQISPEDVSLLREGLRVVGREDLSKLLIPLPLDADDSIGAGSELQASNSPSNTDEENDLKEAEVQNEEAKLMFQKSEYLKAADLYSKALEIAPNKYTEERAKYFKNRAACRLNVEKYKESLDDCNSALTLVPNDAKTMFRKAKCLHNLSRPVDAHSQILEATKQDPTNKDISALASEIVENVKDILQKCQILQLDGNVCYGFGQTDHALKLFSKAASLCPRTFPEEKAGFLESQAKCLFKKGSHEEVIKCCQEGLNIMPEDPKLLYWKLKAEEALNREEDVLETAKLLEPSGYQKSEVESICTQIGKRVKKREKKKRRQKEKKVQMLDSTGDKDASHKDDDPEHGEMTDDIVEAQNSPTVQEQQDVENINKQSLTGSVTNREDTSEATSTRPSPSPQFNSSLKSDGQPEIGNDGQSLASAELEKGTTSLEGVWHVLEKQSLDSEEPILTTPGYDLTSSDDVAGNNMCEQKNDGLNLKPNAKAAEGSLKVDISTDEDRVLQRRILLLSNKWQSWGESVPVVNREMCRALSRGGHHVSCLVLHASDADKDEAARDKVALIKCAAKPGISNDDLQLLYHQSDIPFQPDLVIGHGSLTGQVAMHYAEKFSCPRLHVLHDLPRECKSFDLKATNPDCDEKALALSADFVAAVGVYLKDKWCAILNKNVFEIIPGLPDLSMRNAIPSPQCRCFVAGNFNAPSASGVDIAVWAVNNSNRAGQLYKTTVIASNTEPETCSRPGEEVLKECQELMDNVIDLERKPTPEKQDAIINLQGSTMFITPSRAEAFGVAALDAIAIGIPVLISANSGLAHMIKKYLAEDEDCICEVGSTSRSDRENDVCTWAQKISGILCDRPNAFSSASSLREKWKESFTWDQAMANLMKTLDKFVNLPLASPSTLSSSRIPQSISEADLQMIQEIGLFNKRQTSVLFISPKASDGKPTLANLGLAPWAAVFDFDVNSHENGCLKSCEGLLEKIGKPACRILPPDDKVVPNGVPWVLVEGMNELPRDINNHLDWISEFFQVLKKTHAHPFTFFVLWGSDCSSMLCCKLYDILTVIRSSAVLKDEVQVVLLSTSHMVESRLTDIAHRWATRVRVVDIECFCDAIYSTVISNPMHQEDPDFSLPNTEYQATNLPPNLRWVNSELTVLYTSIGKTPEHGTDDAHYFYRGGKISWYAIEMDYAVERESWSLLMANIENHLKYPGATFLALSHKRGAGGTTSARQLLYSFHQTYPCVCVKAISHATFMAIKVIWEFCCLPVIVLIDNNDLPGEKGAAEALYSSLSIERVWCLIIHVVHLQYGGKREHRSRQGVLTLASTLNDKEKDTFVQVYSSQNRAKEGALKSHRHADKQLQIPFFYGLVAFEDQFQGLKAFVSDCLEDLTQPQRVTLSYIAIAHYYGQKALPLSSFAPIFKISKCGLHFMEDILPANSMELLLEEDGFWRTRHCIIGREMLRQLLTTPYGINPVNWASNLAERALSFIACMDEPYTVAVLLNRIEEESSSQRLFSNLVDDIPEEEDAVRLFKKAMEVFPSNSFFKAHLGRFYSIRKGLHGFDEAIKYTTDGVLCAEEGTQKERTQLNQMKGIVYKRQVHYLIEYGSTIEDIIPLAENAVKAFERAVSISPDASADCYIPQVRMMCDIFQYINDAWDGGLFAYLESENAHQFVIDGITEASEILELVPDSPQYPQLRRLLFRYGHRRCTPDLIKVFEKMKESRKANTAAINRQIVLVHLELCKQGNKKISTVAAELIALLNEALRYDNEVDRTMRLWVRVAPHVPIDISTADSKVTMWCTKEKSTRSYLYKYIIACIRIIEGGKDRYEEVRIHAKEMLTNEVRAITSRFDERLRHPDRPVVFLGNGKGMAQLVSLEDSVREVRKQREVPPNDTKNLRQLTGVITKTDKVGEILSYGLKISFRPDLCQPPLVGDSNKHKKVRFYLGFTFFNADAYNVKVIAE